MPFATTRATLSRQWALLRQLPSRSPGITSAELVWGLRDVGFTVSKRTVERDLNELSLIFPLERNDKSIPFGWHWSASAVGELRGNFDLLTHLRGMRCNRRRVRAWSWWRESAMHWRGSCAMRR